MKYKGLTILLLVILTSCQKVCGVLPMFCKEKKAETIDFNQIDQYPVFKNCDATLGFDHLQGCFEKTLYTKVTTRIGQLHLKTKQNLKETIQIGFTVTKDGSFICKNINTSDSLPVALPNFKIEIQEIIHGIEIVQPALKRGVPVKTNFIIPVEIIVE